MNVGYQKLAAAGVVNTSGRAISLYGVTVNSGAGGAGSAVLYDGTSTSGTLIDTISGVTNESVRESFPNARTFPNGLYVDFGNNTASVVVHYQTIP